MKKSDDTHRISALQLWLDQGWPVHRLREKAQDLWSWSHDKTDGVLAKLREERQTAQNVDRSKYVAQQMTRLEALAVKAQEEGNLSVALGCYKELHALAKLT